MPRFAYHLLDNEIRAIMSQEIRDAASRGDIYFSTRFTEQGRENWVQLLIDAAETQDEHWLAYCAEFGGFFKHLEGRAKPLGGYTVAHIPETAAETLADGQFTRFYIAAVCVRALDRGQRTVAVYRAKVRDNPRAESMMLVGQHLDAADLLAQVRSCSESLKCELLRPNSGLAVE